MTSNVSSIANLIAYCQARYSEVAVLIIQTTGATGKILCGETFNTSFVGVAKYFPSDNVIAYFGTGNGTVMASGRINCETEEVTVYWKAPSS